MKVSKRTTKRLAAWRRERRAEDRLRRDTFCRFCAKFWMERRPHAWRIWRVGRRGLLTRATKLDYGTLRAAGKACSQLELGPL